MNRREVSKIETRGLILQAARELFADKGMEDCTIRDIAGKAGVSPASVVVHFGSKTALLEEALRSDIESALQRLVATLPEGRALEERIMHMFGGFLSLYEGNRELYRSLLGRTIFEAAEQTPGLARQSEEYIRFLGGMIEAERSRGTVREDLDSTLAATSIFSLYMGALIMFFRTPGMTAGEAVGYLERCIGEYVGCIKRGAI